MTMPSPGLDDPRVRRSAIGFAGAVTVMIGITVFTRLSGDELSGRSNSLLALAGVTAVAASSWALWKVGRDLSRGTMAAVTLLALSGILAVAVVNFDLLGQTGLVVTVPFLVPIVLALLGMKR